MTPTPTDRPLCTTCGDGVILPFASAPNLGRCVAAGCRVAHHRAPDGSWQRWSGYGVKAAPPRPKPAVRTPISAPNTSDS